MEQEVTRRMLAKNRLSVKMLTLFWPGKSDIRQIAAVGEAQVRFETRERQGVVSTRLVITSEWKNYDIRGDYYE